jgi:thioredoxin reductase (NADPH)
MKLWPVAIIGAGPAGLSAAIQLKRFGFDPLVFEMDSVGGLLRNANLVENYPGFPGGIPGAALIQLFEEQACSVGVSITPGQVLSLDYDEESFLIQTEAQDYRAQIVIVATGTQPRSFPDLVIPNEAQAKIFYEVYPLLGQTEKEIAIVGAGDAAFDYGLNLAGRGNDILILNRSTELKCLPLLWQRTLNEPRIRYFENTEITQVSGAESGLLLQCRDIEGEVSFKVDFLLGAIGRVPRLGIIAPRVQEHAQTLEKQGLLYFIGDVKNGMYRQTSIAIGDGVRAAMQICQHKESAT